MVNISTLASLEPVSGTGVELNKVAASFAPNEVHEFDEDTETNFKNNAAPLREASVISIATHGLMPRDFEDGEWPAPWFFYAACAAAFSDDGLLQGAEIASMTFQADWRILYACNTATSDTAVNSFASLTRVFYFRAEKPFWRRIGVSMTAPTRA